MKLDIDFCDLCFSHGAYRLASMMYRTSAGELTVTCTQCSDLVREAGLLMVPLPVREGLFEDIADGLPLKA